MHANPNPEHFWMSYANGLAGSSPKFVEKKISDQSVTAGKRRSIVGRIGIFRPANLQVLV
jgi:hypothetical protein